MMCFELCNLLFCPGVVAVPLSTSQSIALFGHVLAKGGRLDAFIAADDPEAKARVSTFIESLGLRPLDVGGLHMAATLEALGLMMIGLAKNGAGTWDIALNVTSAESPTSSPAGPQHHWDRVMSHFVLINQLQWSCLSTAAFRPSEIAQKS